MKHLMLALSALLAIFLFSGCGSVAQVAQQAPALVFPSATGGAGQTPASGTKAGTTLLTYRGHGDWVTAVAWSPDGKEIASGSNDATVQIWDASTGNQIMKFNRQEQVTSLAWSPDGKRIAVAGLYGPAVVFDATSGKALLMYTGQAGPIKALAWSPDGTRIASVSSASGGETDPNPAQEWDAVTGARIVSYQGHGNNLLCVAWSPDGTRIVTGGWDRTAQVWQA